MLDEIFNRIEFVKKHTTKSEKILIDYLLKCNLGDIIYMSITELADIVKVSEATILRFCKKMDFSGYQEFKLRLAMDVKKPETTDGGYGAKIAENMISAINLAKDVIDYQKVDKAVGLITGCKNLFFFGVGNSYAAALEAKNRLSRAGIFSDCVGDVHFQSIITANLTPDDVIVFISVSGSTIDLVESARAAKQRGVKTVVITGYEKAPLCKYADVALYSIKKEAPMDGGSLISKVTQLFTVDVLCTAVYMKMGNEAKERIESASKAVLSKLM